MNARFDVRAGSGQRRSGRARGLLVAGLVAAFAGAVIFGPEPAAAQRGTELEQMRQAFSERNDATLAEPYRGITSGPAERDLFPIRASGVSTEPVRRAAQAFLAALTPEQRARTTFKVDDIEWRKWANQDIYLRQGVSFLDMTEAQREKAFDLIRAGLSAKGFTQTRDIMRLNYTLGELNENNFDRYGEWRYYITVMGEPSATEPWGWQFDGHHAVVNYFVLGDQVVMTPLFAGSEPVIARSGKYAGTVVLQEEQKRGLAMLGALNDAQRKQAIVSVSKAGNNNIGEAFKDNQVLDYAGIPATALTQAQRGRLVDLVGLFVSNMKEDQARVRMDEVRRHLDRTYFSWIGNTQAGKVFYYRIHSPVILIEFDHQVPVGLRHLSQTPTLPNPEHIHVVIRTPNGNDYGKDLLRQHYAQHPHQ
jgi:hypothetical protein